MKDKKEMVEEVKSLIVSFSKKHLPEEEEAICLHIWEKLARKQKLDINKDQERYLGCGCYLVFLPGELQI